MRDLAVALLLVSALPAAAAPVASAPAAAAVTLPFQPPLGVPLAYGYTMESTVGDSQRQHIETRDELRFSRAAGGGYTLRWSSSGLKVEAPGPLKAVLEKTYGALMGTPLLLSVSAGGAPQHVLNLAEVRGKTEAAMTALMQSLEGLLAALPPESRDGITRMLTAMIDQQRQQSDEALEQSLLEGPLQLLPGLGPMVPGQPRTVELEQPSPLGGGSIGFLTQLELSRYEAGKAAQIRVSSAANPEDARRVTEAFLQTMIANIADPAERSKAEAAVAGLGALSISELSVIDIALPEGLATASSYEKRLSLPGQPPRVDTRRYVRLP